MSIRLLLVGLSSPRTEISLHLNHLYDILLPIYLYDIQHAVIVYPAYLKTHPTLLKATRQLNCICVISTHLKLHERLLDTCIPMTICPTWLRYLDCFAHNWQKRSFNSRVISTPILIKNHHIDPATYNLFYGSSFHLTAKFIYVKAGIIAFCFI